MPTSKNYLKDFVLVRIEGEKARFSKSNFDSVARCFFYTVLSLRLWKQLKIDQENVPGTDVWFPVPRGDPTSEAHEKRIREFVDAVLKNKIKLAESGTIVVTKFETKSFALGLWNPREEYERWYLRYQLDVVGSEELSNQLSTMLEELNSASLAEGQASASSEEVVEFDIQFASS